MCVLLFACLFACMFDYLLSVCFCFFTSPIESNPKNNLLSAAVQYAIV